MIQLARILNGAFAPTYFFHLVLKMNVNCNYKSDCIVNVYFFNYFFLDTFSCENSADTSIIAPLPPGGGGEIISFDDIIIETMTPTSKKAYLDEVRTSGGMHRQNLG